MPQPPKPPSPKDAAHEIAPRDSSRAEIDAFLAQVRSAPSPATSGHGRLIFAMDATMSRQPTWDMALQVQAEMFNAVKAVGGLDVKLVFFRGFDECKSSRWVSDATALARLMTAVECRGGFTQIRKVLKHALGEAANGKVSALVYVGDAMEENVDELANLAGQLGLRSVPVFLFQEGYDGRAQSCLRRDRAANAWRDMPLRAGIGGAVARASRSRRRLRGRWTQGACGLCKRPRRSYFAARTDVEARAPHAYQLRGKLSALRLLAAGPCCGGNSHRFLHHFY